VAAEALGWGAGRGDSPDGYRERDWRPTSEPSFALTEKVRSWVYVASRQENAAVRGMDELAFGHAACDAGFVNTGRDWKKGGTREDAQQVPASALAPALTGKSGEQWHLSPPDVGRVEQRRGGERIHEGVDPRTDPSMTVTSRADRWQGRPATTVQGDSRLWPPGHKVNASDRERLGEEEANERYGDRAGTDAIRLTVADALALQSFPAGYPIYGTKTAQFRQVGDAVPPLLAYHVLRAVAG